MPEDKIPTGTAYSYGFHDGGNHVLDVLSQKVGELCPPFSDHDRIDGYLYAIEEILGIIGQERK